MGQWFRCERRAWLTFTTARPSPATSPVSTEILSTVESSVAFQGQSQLRLTDLAGGITGRTIRILVSFFAYRRLLRLLLVRSMSCDCITAVLEHRSGPNSSAWAGLVPKQNSSGGKLRLSNISKQGDRYLAACSQPISTAAWLSSTGLNLATTRQAIMAMLDKRPVPLLSAT